MPDKKQFDIVIFGASGFTGRVAVLQLTKLTKDKNYENLKWAVAGRSVGKTKSVLMEVTKKTGVNVYENVYVITADVEDEKSLNAMAAMTKVVINCVGPYRLYGEPVVRACIANGTHHVDVSGEPQFMESIQLNYNEQAKEKGVYIISACGFDSIPADLGLIDFINKFKGDVNSVETYLETEVSGKLEGASIHYGTWESAIYGVLYRNEIRPLREKLFPTRLPKLTPKLASKPVLHNSLVIGKWCLPFPGSDRPVMYRSQRHLYETEKTRPVQVQSYVGFPSLLQALIVTFFAGIIAVMTKLSFTRRLLLNYPKFFSGGLVSHEGPTETTMSNTLFSVTFYGEGWSERASVEEGHSTPPDKTMVTRVSGRDPGYGFTTTALILAAITVLRESDKMPGNGGVLPPGAAFAKTSLIKQLEANGLKFEVIKEETKNQTGTGNGSQTEIKDESNVINDN